MGKYSASPKARVIILSGLHLRADLHKRLAGSLHVYIGIP